MYSVLIADDEEPVLECCSILLEREEERCRLISCARNGIEALDMLRSKQPDIAYIDINMPGIDGLEVIERAKPDCPNCVFILSTAYERFDLAQRAIPLGVHAYLVKPLSSKQFLASLVQAMDHLDQDLSNCKKISSNILQTNFLRSLAWEAISEESWRELAAGLNLQSQEGTVAFLWTDCMDKSLYQVFSKELEKTRRFLKTDYLHSFLFYFPSCSDQERLRTDMQRLLEKVYGSASQAWLSIEGFSSKEELPGALKKALETLRNDKRHSEALVRERLRGTELRRKLGFCSQEEAERLFETYWKDIFSHWGFERSRYKMTALFSLLLDDVFGFWKDGGEEAVPFIPSDAIALIESVPEWESWSKRAFAQLWERASRKLDLSISPPLRKALAIIEERHHEQIQLSDVAALSGVSAGYLSKLFSEQLGNNFIDCLTRLRIEKAERLLCEGGLSVKETSHACGYTDPNYFGKIFKKITGICPGAYAQRNHEH